MEKNGKNDYELCCQKANSQDLRDEYWRQKATEVNWFKFPTQILDNNRPEFARWYSNGQINITYNMIDRYLEKHADKQALIWVSNMVNQQKIYTLRQVYENVCKMCLLLRQHGVKKSDRVIIYMPMIPEALFSTWACARIGAVHSIIFGGFAAKQLEGRIIDAKPKLIVTASCGLEPNKVVNYVQILKQAIALSSYSQTVLIYERPQHEIKCPQKCVQFKDVECQKMNSNDYLYILYTSGSTGTPKGIVRDQGGTAVVLEWNMKHIMGINFVDVYFASSDIGWVVGHSFTIYGPLLRGAASRPTPRSADRFIPLVMTRLDYIINTAGHRLSTAQMQQVLMGHKAVSQAAVVAMPDELKGQVPIGFVVLKINKKIQNIEKELIQLIRHQIGPVASFQHVIVVEKLPKTKSGKILRKILRKIIQGEQYKFPATIEDEQALQIVKIKVKQYGKRLGQHSKLIYRGDVDRNAHEKFKQ